MAVHGSTSRDEAWEDRQVDPYIGTAEDGTVFLHHRTTPDRLRYLAGKLRDNPGNAESVALVLDMTAGELEVDHAD